MPLPDDFIEIDFLAVETAKSGDAITIRCNIGGLPYITVVDGGFMEMGEKIESHIGQYYTNQAYVDYVILTHPDQDHASGLRYVVENLDVRSLWMNRSWLYANELIDSFKNYTNLSNLELKLRECYPLLQELEELAIERGIPIYPVFQGQTIGAFTVLSPSKEFFLRKVVESTRTPVAADAALTIKKLLLEIAKLAKATVKFVIGQWGEESLKNDPTSAENEMSVIQFAAGGDTTFLLTGDAGREALAEAIAYAPYVNLSLPGIDVIQVPHHGSRRNVSSALLDQLVGPKLNGPIGPGNELFTAIISSAEADVHHPKKAVERAFHHRGAKVLATEGASIVVGWNRPARNWSSLPSRPYPTTQEE